MRILRAAALLLTAAALLTPAAAFAEGAIAVGRHGEAGISYRFNSPVAAERKALSECGRESCHIVEHFRNRCAAIATARSGQSGWATRPDVHEASRVALHNCRGEGSGQCAVQVRGCD